MRNYLSQGLFISTILSNMLYLYLLPMNIIEMSILFPFFFPLNTKFKIVLFQHFKSTLYLYNLSILLSLSSSLWSTISTYIQCSVVTVPQISFWVKESCPLASSPGRAQRVPLLSSCRYGFARRTHWLFLPFHQYIL